MNPTPMGETPEDHVEDGASEVRDSGQQGDSAAVSDSISHRRISESSDSTSEDSPSQRFEFLGDLEHSQDDSSENDSPGRMLIFHRIDPANPNALSSDNQDELPTDERVSMGSVTAGSVTATDKPTIRPLRTSRSSRQNDSLKVDSSSIHRHRNKSRRSDPIVHGCVMLVTLMLMFAAARFVIPGIVEEIRYAQHRGQLRAEFEVASEGLKNVSLDAISQAYQMVTAKSGPSVVHIDVRRRERKQERLPVNLPGAPMIPISDQGSGVVVDSDGYILTNRHVIAGGQAIDVTLSDGRVMDAIVVGTDELTDLAVLKVDADALIPIEWGDSDRIRVGSPVWAIGSPFGLDRTVTFGILSGKHRVVRASDRYQDFMQSDVAVNPGNSGGPLVDSHGTLIGINTAIVGDTYQGVSFAIPSVVAKKIYETLLRTGRIDRGWLGVSLSEVPDDLLVGDDHRMRGALIISLADQRSGAARAGLQPGDIVVRVDQRNIRDVDHLMQVIGNAMAGTKIQLSVLREGENLDFQVSLGRRPDPIE